MIDENMYNANKDKYNMDDLIGRDGIQYTLEEYLKGEDGVRQIDMAVDGTITEETISKEAIAGNNVTLTIDANLQKKTEETLANNIKKIASGKADGKKRGTKTGAAVVMDVKTGEVLAMASYPDYEPELFINGISQAKFKEYDKGKNLYNNVIGGVYAPGSTFKMVSATAALESGIFTPTTKVNDNGRYPLGHHPACWIYNEYGYGHGYLNITQAIQKSCNYYFYEVGTKVGIDKIAEYANAYGLGRKTGIELAGENIGTVATKEYCKKLEGRQWQIGDTLSAVIGQSYNNYTPIQMARYISMLSNGGKAVEVTTIKSITDQEGKQIPKDEIERKVNEKLGIDDSSKVQDLQLKPDTLQSILKGMKGVTSETGGTAYYIFSDLGMEIGGKTGSVETNIDNKTNGWFVGFAPYNKPEIAVVVVIEDAGSGGNVAPVAKEIIKEYFGTNVKKVEEDVTAIPSTQSDR